MKGSEKMEKYILGFKFRIYPNKTQQELINKTLGCCRFVYNHFLAIRGDEWTANNNSVTYSQTSAMLTDLKRYEEYSWLKEVDSMALQESLKNLDTAYQNFFKHQSRYPRFKSKHNHSQSYRTRNQGNGIRIIGNRIKLLSTFVTVLVTVFPGNTLAGFCGYVDLKRADSRALSFTVSGGFFSIPL